MKRVLRIIYMPAATNRPEFETEKETQWPPHFRVVQAPQLYGEVIAVALDTLLHFCKNNMLHSIAGGRNVYLIVIQIILLVHFSFTDSSPS